MPPRPAGRIWLLRPPAGYATVDEVLNEMRTGWQASGGSSMATAQLVAYAEARLGELFSPTSI